MAILNRHPLSVRFLNTQISCAMDQFHLMENNKPDFATKEHSRYQRARSKILAMIQEMEHDKNLIINHYENNY